MKINRGQALQVSGLGMITAVGFDFFLHAGLLSGVYSAGGAFLLPVEVAFRRIPFGYAAIAIQVLLLTWLMLKIHVTGWKNGLTFGFALGALIWGAEALGLYSVTTVPPGLLSGWFFGQSIELGFAGMVIGSGFAAASIRGLMIKVGLFFLACIVSGVVLQNVTG